jgi:hypothetical protein
MTQKNAAGERLAKIETRYLKDIAWDELKPQSVEEHTTFLLSQVERLLSEPTDEPISVAQSFVDEYFADGELYRLAMLPLKSHTGDKIALTWDQFHQYTVCVIACICKDLLDRGFYDSKGLFGVKGAFDISNKDLLDWLYTTPYEHIAFHVASTLKAYERKAYSMRGYLPALDETAAISSEEHDEPICCQESTKMSPRAHTKAILEKLVSIDRHWERGRQLKLNVEVLMLHDSILGCIPPRFDKKVVEAALALHDYMDNEVCDCLHPKEGSAPLADMPESFRVEYNDVMGKVTRKTREVCNQHLGEGWLEDHPKAFEYVMAYAEDICGYCPDRSRYKD